MDSEDKKQLEEKQEKIGNLLLRLKKINKVYLVATEEQRGMLLENSQFILDELVEFGFDRVFIETLLVGGEDFVESFFKEERDSDIYGIAKLIFG